jgi:uncharacterized protein (TIGR03437 family)
MLRRVTLGAVLVALSAAVALASNPVFVAASYGLYKSTDAGATWAYVNIPLNNPLLSGNIIADDMAADPHDSSKIYFLGIAKANAFFATLDGGQTWTVTPFIGMVPDRLAVDNAGKAIYITATATGGDRLLYVSTNVGASWTRLKVPNTSSQPATRFPNGSPVSHFAVDPTVSGTVYVDAVGGIFFKSADFGQTWTMVATEITSTTGSVFPQTTILDIYPDPWNPQTWYNATNHNAFPQTCPVTNGGLCGLFKSTNGGVSFAGLSVPSDYVSSVSFGGASGTVYATGEVSGLGGTVFKTTDAGSTWTPIKNGLFTPQSGRIWADITDPSTVYVNDSLSRHDFYVSTDAGGSFTQIKFPTGPPGCVPGNCGQQEIHDVVFAPATNPAPVITSVVNGASLQPGVPANSWVTVFGTNLAPATDNWGNFIVNGKLPTVVDGVSVSMGGQAAYVYFISPSQLNVLAPNVSSGPVSVTVTTPAGTSAPFTSTASLYGPALFTWPNSQAVATRQDFSFAVKAGTFSGATTTPAKPGDVLILWTTGLGPTAPPAPVGVAVPGDKTYATSSAPTVTINSAPAIVFGAALAPAAVGLYQIAIQVPNNLADGDWPILLSIGGAQSPSGIVLSVHQ